MLEKPVFKAPSAINKKKKSIKNVMEQGEVFVQVQSLPPPPAKH